MAGDFGELSRAPGDRAKKKGGRGAYGRSLLLVKKRNKNARERTGEGGNDARRRGVARKSAMRDATDDANLAMSLLSKLKGAETGRVSWAPRVKSHEATFTESASATLTRKPRKPKRRLQGFR